MLSRLTNVDQFKADAFALGMVLLKMCTLKEDEELKVFHLNNTMADA